jgi:hypothetical protein
MEKSKKLHLKTREKANRKGVGMGRSGKKIMPLPVYLTVTVRWLEQLSYSSRPIPLMIKQSTFKSTMYFKINENYIF